MEHEYSRRQLLGIRNIVSTLFLTEVHYNLDLLTTELLSLFEREEDRQAISLFLNWFRQLREHGRVAPGDYAEIETIYRSAEEARTMLLTALEKEREEMRRQIFAEVVEQIIEQGIEQGIDQGAERKQREIARAMHAKGYSFEVIADLFGLTLEQVNDLLSDEQSAA